MTQPAFRILGDLDVVGRDGAIRIGGRRRRTLLALVLLHAGERLSIDAICDAVWEGEPPDGAPSTVRTYLSQFRKLDVAGDGLRFDPDPAGYRVTVDRAELDATQFEDRLEAACAVDHSLDRLELLDAALDLWRGPALAEFADDEWARAGARRLSELRDRALKDRFDALLSLGRHRESVPELEATAASAPLDERFAAQLALARYRSGGVSDALRGLGALRRRLGDELGLSPGPEILDLERRMLERDPTLDAEPTGALPATGNRSDVTSSTRAEPRLPRGTVTFLFTDIEGSTRLLGELGDDAYATLLTRHRRLLADAVERNGGVVFGSEGDALFCAFESAAAATEAALEGQRSLDEDGPQVRMGLHTGEALVVDDDYVGTTVHVTARITSAAHGGQAVASDACRTLAPDVDWIDLGTHRLKDVERAQQLHQLVVDDAEFPPLATADNVPSNLPEPLDSFIGRADDIAALAGRFATTRMISLLGPGGVGKTRLAIETARTLRSSHAGGVHLVELAQVTTGGDVAAAVTRVLIGNGARGSDLRSVVADIVSGESTLLVLDNCEHVLVESAEVVAALLEAEATLRVLCTSREPLRVRGELVHHVAPLPTAATDGDRSPADRLFVARAEAARGRPVAADDLEIARRICEDLDGLPLAIELAASRTTSLALVDIAQRLDDRFALLRSTRTGDDERHRTLRAVVDWSYELLPPVDRALFNRLSVFGDAFTLDAAEAIAGGDPVPTDYVLDGLAHLVDKSLVQLSTIEGASGYRMLETLRSYGRDRLADTGKLGDAQDRLVAWAMGLVAGLERDMRTERQDSSLRNVLPHTGNLRTALDVQRERNRPVEALRIVAAAPIDVAPERCRLIDSLIPLVAAGDDPMREEALGRAHLAASNLEFERGRFEAGADHGRTAAELFEALGDERSVAWSAFLETFGAWGMGDEGRARRAVENARDRFARLGDRVGLANASWVLILLDRDLEHADELGSWAERELRAIDSPFALAHCLEARSLVDLRRDRPSSAGPRLAEALDIFSSLRNQGCVAHCLEAIAAHAVAVPSAGAEAETTAELLGAAEALRLSSGHRHRPWELAGQRAALDVLREELAPDVLDAAVRAGHGHRLDSATALGTRVLSGASGARTEVEGHGS